MHGMIRLAFVYKKDSAENQEHIAYTLARVMFTRTYSIYVGRVMFTRTYSAYVGQGYVQVVQACVQVHTRF
jgi:hypothetical protein